MGGSGSGELSPSCAARKAQPEKAVKGKSPAAALRVLDRLVPSVLS